MAMANLCKYRSKPVRLRRGYGGQAKAGLLVVLICMGLSWPAPGWAQSIVGGGPLTSSLPDVEPTVGVFTVGRVRLAPGMTIREIGWDSNVFDEPEEAGPKSDWVVSAQPDVSAFTRLRFLRISAYAGSDLTYFHRFDTERSVGHNLRGRVDFLLSRVRPFIGAGQVESRTRPNGEIDTRADRQEEELSGGVAFDLSAHSLVYGAAYLTSSIYENALEDGVDLGISLTRHSDNYEGGVKTDLTPFLSMRLSATYGEDTFTFEPIRNSQFWFGGATFSVATDAVVSGTVSLMFRDMTFRNPTVRPFRGVVGIATLTYPLLEIGRITGGWSRGVEYSFNVAETYYVEQTAMLAYTQRLFGSVDAQLRGSRSTFEYSAQTLLPEHTDTLELLNGSVGYNLRNRTRIALNYEHARRRSPAIADRNYARRRAFLSWQFAF